MIISEYKGIFFDLDGVLVDACDWHFQSLNRALVEFGRDPISYELHIEKFNGLPTRTKLSMLNIDPEEAKKIEICKQKHTSDIISSQAYPMPEKHELHRHLKSLGFKIACVTNSIRKTADQMLTATGQKEFIDLLISNEDVSINKPNPEPYLKAMVFFGFEPKKCICVEDSPNGIAAAEASGAMLWRVKNTNDVNLSKWSLWIDGK